MLLDRAKQGIFKKKIHLLIDNSSLKKNALTLASNSIWRYDDPIKVKTLSDHVCGLSQHFTVYNETYGIPLCFKNKATNRIGYCTMTWIRRWLEMIALPIALSKFDDLHKAAAKDGTDLVAQVEYRVRVKKEEQSDTVFPSLSGWSNKFSSGDKIDVNEILSDHQAYLEKSQWKSKIFLDEPELLKLYIQEIKGLKPSNS